MRQIASDFIPRFQTFALGLLTYIYTININVLQDYYYKFTKSGKMLGSNRGIYHTIGSLASLGFRAATLTAILLVLLLVGRSSGLASAIWCRVACTDLDVRKSSRAAQS